MNASSPKLDRLRSAFKGRKKPTNWILSNLHPFDALDATDFIRDIEAGKDRPLLFQSAIPYFSFLTDEARLFLLPDLFATFLTYPSEIVTKILYFEDDRGKNLLALLTREERNAVAEFTSSLIEWEGMRFYLDDIKSLAVLVQPS